ncbi:MurR/RpiR family transcriptional regulator [Niameybacter massiliensis]|uniref:MurR/RpiR family transcriptional regulator n=2 Tax=Clostridia TaxID=186801 RepID=A0AA42DPL1_9FIRM|nr:MurR/RpiR family transcriptional regulator [Holtiella tumoricola]MDA3732501.1 MurR/RpiR family transcriptional regulator [Holtiella tumoricola]
MNMNNDLIHRIKKSMPKLSKGQKLIANYILEHYEKAVFLTAAKLGTIVGVSESTVVRFANELGYDGYPKFQDALEELVKSKLTAMQRLEVTTDRIDVNHVLKSVLQTDQEKIAYTIEQIDEETFDMAIDKILAADTIYILGVRSCAGLASFLGFYFNIIFPRVKVINTNSISEIFELLHHISENDVIIGISFPRYSKRILKALEYARSRQAGIIAITDSYISPIAQYAEHTLIGRSEMVSFVDSLVAPLSIINAIIVAVSLRMKDEISTNLDNLETVWMEYEVYDDTREVNTPHYTTPTTVKEKCD